MPDSIKDIERQAKELEKEIAKLSTQPHGTKRGRPSKFTPAVVTKLVAAFNMGYNDTEAAAYASISRKTFYDYICDKPDFRNKINRAKIEPTIKAKEVVVNALNAGDLGAAKWWLERKSANEFSTKPVASSEIPTELEEHISGLKEVVRVTEQRICNRYRIVIYRLREQERASNQGGGGRHRGNASNGLKEAIYTRLLELPNDKLADHIEQEVIATGQDIAGVRDLLSDRLDWQAMYREQYDKIKYWDELEE